MRRSLIDVARERTVLTDGGIGTELQLRGLPPGACGEAWNEDQPNAVRDIHVAYGAAGAEALLTNTFGGSRIALARHGQAARAGALNRAGAALAREVAGDRWVIGDVGPTGEFLAPLGTLDPADADAAFLEQTEALLEGGADGILVETMTALDELACAVKAAQRAGAPFVLASLAFDGTPVGPRTMMGVTPEQAAAAALELGVDALGANCGANLDIAGYADVLARFRRTAPDMVLLCRPNAGTPRLEQGAIVYPLDARRLAHECPLLTGAGARLLGGCCGTTPAHIAAMRDALGRE